jgi:hypothetical protein
MTEDKADFSKGNFIPQIKRKLNFQTNIDNSFQYQKRYWIFRKSLLQTRAIRTYNSCLLRRQNRSR